MEIRRFEEGDETILSNIIRRDLREINLEDPVDENEWLYNHYTPEYIKTAAKKDHTYVITDNDIPIATGNVKLNDDRSVEICGCFIYGYLGKNPDGLVEMELPKK